MAWQIDIERLKQPLLEGLFKQILPVFNQMGLQFFVIGAMARDIWMQLHDEEPNRRTRDIDFALAIDRWEDFSELKMRLSELPDFKIDSHQEQRLIYRNVLQMDIVPFGGVAQQDDRIFWPPDGDFAMSVLGFQEVANHLSEVQLMPNFKIPIASLAGVFLLKLVAWSERNIEGSKDADDLGFILTNYLNINEERAVREFYEPVYEMEPFSMVRGGAVLLGNDINRILGKSKTAKQKIRAIINEQLKQDLESKLFNQIIETNKQLKFEEIRDGFGGLLNQIN